MEFLPELNASQLLQDKVRNHPRFDVHTNTQVTEFVGSGGRLQEVVTIDRDSGEERRWTPDGVFVFIGLDPNTGFLRGTLELDRWGFVETEHFETSMPNVYAAGDVRAGATKQLAAAVGEGAAALLAIRERAPGGEAPAHRQRERVALPRERGGAAARPAPCYMT